LLPKEGLQRGGPASQRIAFVMAAFRRARRDVTCEVGLLRRALREHAVWQY